MSRNAFRDKSDVHFDCIS